jgi:hypothetical protein
MPRSGKMSGYLRRDAGRPMTTLSCTTCWILGRRPTRRGNSVLSEMQYPHRLMVAGAVTVVLGFVGFAFRRKSDHKDGNGDEREEVDDEDQAPTRVKHRQGD